MRPAGNDYDIDEKEPPQDECDRAWSTLEGERQPFDSDHDMESGAPNQPITKQKLVEGGF